MENKLNRFLQVFLGITIATFGISLVLNCGLGCFAESAVYKGISNLFGLPLFVVNTAFEIIMIAIATYKGEGLGWTAIINATYGAVMINIFHKILPTHPIMILGIFLMPVGWSILEKARLGSTGTNILMKALMKATGKSLVVVRTCIEFIFLLIGYLTAPEYTTWFTVFLTFGTPILLKIIYNLVGHKPADVKHDFIIGNKNK